MRPTRDGLILAATDAVKSLFWARVDRESGDSCWLWRGHVAPNGYSQFTMPISGKRMSVWAHRCAYLFSRGAIAGGLQLDHLCRNRACVNPAHLEPVSARENLMRGDTHAARNASKTHCPNGHSYAGDNLRQFGGKRQCYQCVLAHGRKYDAKRRALKKMRRTEQEDGTWQISGR